MFLQTNDRIINLKNVSNINFLTKRIVFNLNYSIEIDTHKEKNKVISDYVYWDSISPEDYKDNSDYIRNNEYIKSHFIWSSDGSVLINIDSISSVKFSDKKCRVIFNLSHPITFKDFDGNDRLTSEYVYANCNANNYSSYVKYVKNILRQ